MKRPTILDELRACPKPRRGTPSWYEQIEDKSLRRELDDVRAAVRSGEITTPRLTLAKALSRSLAARGVVIGHQGIIRWLAAD